MKKSKTSVKPSAKKATKKQTSKTAYDGLKTQPESVETVLKRWDDAKDKDRALDNILGATLAGDHKRKWRVEVMFFLTGQTKDASKCGVTALRPLLKKFFDLRWLEQEQNKEEVPGSKNLAIAKSILDNDFSNPEAGKDEVKHTAQPVAALISQALVGEPAVKHQPLDESKVNQVLTDELKAADTYDKVVAVNEKAVAEDCEIVTLKGTRLGAFERVGTEPGKPEIIQYAGGKKIFIFKMKSYFVVAHK